MYDLGQVINGAPNPAETTINDTVNLTVATVNNSQPPNGNAYFVSAGGNGINLSIITGTPTQHNVALSHQTFGSPAFAATTEPAVNGGFLGGGDLDNRVLSAAFEQQFSNGHFVIEFSGNTECSNQAQLCAYDVKLDLNTTPATIIKNVQLGATGQSYSYGSVALDGQGNAYLAYSKSDPNNTPDADVLATDTNGTILFNSTTHAHTAGTTACGAGTCDERWGDYFGGAQDPSNPNVVWTVAQWQQSSGLFGWGTEISAEQSSGVIMP